MLQRLVECDRTTRRGCGGGVPQNQPIKIWLNTENHNSFSSFHDIRQVPNIKYKLHFASLLLRGCISEIRSFLSAPLGYKRKLYFLKMLGSYRFDCAFIVYSVSNIYIFHLDNYYRIYQNISI